MATLKLVLRKNKSADGSYPLTIRITKDRKTSWIYLNTNLFPDQWDEIKQKVKKSHPNSTRLNAFLATRLAEAANTSIEIETTKKEATSRAIRSKVVSVKSSNFFLQAENYLSALKQSGKYNQYTADKPRVSHFKDFLKGSDIAFSDISVGLLDRFCVYLRSTHRHIKNGKPISERTIMNHFVVIRSVYAFAVKNEVIPKGLSPFGKGGMKISFPDSVKIGLNKDEIAELEKVELSERANHARNLWLISYYFAGVRISDVLRLRWSDIQDNRLHYVMGKNDKGDSLKLPEKAVKIFDTYKPFKKNKNDLIFEELKGVDFDNEFVTKRTIAFKTSAIDKILKNEVAKAANIEKKLTTHIARHSFAQNATGIDARILQRLFRHTKLETTIGYMGHFTHNTTDEALETVLNR